MPMPWTCRHSEQESRAVLDDARERMDLASVNMTYTAVDDVLRVFRRRLTCARGIAFARVLPSTLGAIFVAGWDVTAPRLPFRDRAAMTAEGERVRRNHNLTSDIAIEATAWALRPSMDPRDLDRVLADLPDGARDFRRVVVDDPVEMTRRIV